jgi:type IV pilus assembly protein PilB
MVARGRKRIGDCLIEAGKITQEQLNKVLEEQSKSGRRIGEILLEDGFVKEDDILDALEIQLGIPRVSIEILSVEPEAVKLIPETLASKHVLFPVAIKGNKLQVVMADPLNIFSLDDVRIASRMEVEPLLGSREDIKNAISRYYSGQLVKKAADELSRENVSEAEAQEIDLENVRNAPAVRLVDSIIIHAVKARASDIHIEPFEKYIKIRYRIDGELSEVLRPAKETLGALVTRIKILANLNIAEKRLPQDGRIITKVDDKDVDLRVSVLPTVFGEKVVIRILSKNSSLINKRNLGLEEEDLEKLERIISSPHGIILVTGPTGSGKSTTLYAMLNELNTVNKNIITVEDPVEYLLEGVNQVGVNVKAGLTFAAGLRSILRQDPDIIMIGEIRDNETAEIAIRSAITGHLVLSTIHTNDAPSAVIRLTDMDIEPYLVATSISGVIAQRLVKRICPHCSRAYTADNYEKKQLEIDLDRSITLHRGEGCSVCGGTGYLGRVGVYEIMEITRHHREYIMQNRSTDELKDISLSNGMKTLAKSCRDLVLRGVTTFDEMMKISHIKE